MSGPAPASSPVPVPTPPPVKKAKKRPAPKPRPLREDVARFKSILGLWLDGYGAAVADQLRGGRDAL